MKGLYIVFCLVSLFALGYADLEMIDATEPLRVQPGAEVSWKMVYKGNIMDIINSHPIKCYHEFSWNGADQRTHIFSNGQNQDGADPDVWQIKLEMGSDEINLNAELKDVKPEHNGRFVCERGEGDDITQVGQDIIVLEDIKSIELTIDGNTFTDDNSTPLQLEFDEPHDVHCRVMGANPGAEKVKIILQGEDLDTGDNVIEPMDTPTPAYSTKTGTYVLHTTKAHEGNVLSCDARGPNDDLIRASATLGIKIRSPNITCSNQDAYPGKKYVFMKCHVDTTNVPGNITMAVKIDTIGDVIPVGEERTIKGHRIVVDVKECFEEEITSNPCPVKIPNKYTIITKIAQVDDWHLNTPYTLEVLSKGGHVTSEKMSLVRVDAPITTAAPASRSGDDDEGYNSGFSVAASLSLVCVATLLTLIRGL